MILGHLQINKIIKKKDTTFLRKSQVYSDLRTEQTKIYNWLIGNLILKILEQ